MSWRFIASGRRVGASIVSEPTNLGTTGSEIKAHLQMPQIEDYSMIEIKSTSSPEHTVNKSFKAMVLGTDEATGRKRWIVTWRKPIRGADPNNLFNTEIDGSPSETSDKIYSIFQTVFPGAVGGRRRTGKRRSKRSKRRASRRRY
jgi:hypothetical protein